MNDESPNDRLTRPAAAELATRLAGRRVSVDSLVHLARTGGGPPFVMLLGRATYRRRDIVDWLDTAGQPPRAAGQRRRQAEAAEAEA